MSFKSFQHCRSPHDLINVISDLTRNLNNRYWQAGFGCRIKFGMTRQLKRRNIEALYNRKLFITIFVSCILFMVGCSVPPPPPTHYFLLEIPVPSAEAQNESPKHPVFINLAEIVLIPPYNSENLVVKLSGGEIQFYNYQKWGAPPATMIQNYLNKKFLYANRFNVSDRKVRIRNSLLLKLEFQEFAHNREKQVHSSNMVVLASLTKNSTSGYNWYKLYNIRVPTKSNQVPDIIKAFNTGIKQLSSSLLKDIDLFLSNQTFN